MFTGVDANTATVKCPTVAPSGECKSKRDFEVPSTDRPSGEENEDDYDYGEQKVRGKIIFGARAGEERVGGTVYGFPLAKLNPESLITRSELLQVRPDPIESGFTRLGWTQATVPPGLGLDLQLAS